MSVYTTVGRAELAGWLAPLGVGDLIDHAGIAAGMQNSNYFVTTTGGRFVLTLFEHLDPAAITAYLDLQAHLAERGLPCPRPARDEQGRCWRLLAGKPAALLTCLPGENVDNPDVGQCRAIGETLARLHLAAADFPNPPPNPCGRTWRRQIGSALLPLLPPDEQALLADELAAEAGFDDSSLPRGVIHTDLFRDNVLWENGRLSGLLDFYFAGEDALLFDLAVVANDWCPDAERLTALLEGYAARRPPSPAEKAAWMALRRFAALRFWLLRLDVRHRPRAGEVVTIKNPDHFRHMLERFRLAPEPWPV